MSKIIKYQHKDINVEIEFSDNMIRKVMKKDGRLSLKNMFSKLDEELNNSSK